MRKLLVSAIWLAIAMPAIAQIRTQPAEELSDEYNNRQQQPLRQEEPVQPGRVAQSSVGQAGQRQTREQFADSAQIGRVAGRIQNRVQLRLRNRIDRSYDPQANATSPFAVAENQARAAVRRRR